VSSFNICRLLVCLVEHRGLADVKLHPRNHTPEGVECSAACLAIFIPWKDQVAIENVVVLQEVGSVTELVWTGAKISLPKGFDSQTFKYVDSRHTSYAILSVFFRMDQQ